MYTYARRFEQLASRQRIDAIRIDSCSSRSVSVLRQIASKTFAKSGAIMQPTENETIKKKNLRSWGVVYQEHRRGSLEDWEEAVRDRDTG